MTNFRHCAILSMDSLEGFECYDYLIDEPLRNLGWQTHTISWKDQSVDWNDYEVVIVRSPWDYQDAPEQFLQVLQNIDESSATLENPLALIQWNINKTYLRDLQDQGIGIVPTIWRNHFDAEEMENFYQSLEVDEIVIKPNVSANADNTFRLKRDHFQDSIQELSKIFSDRPFMVQPFMQSIVDEGEFSLFYFAGKYSHCILKTPEQDDFRVQEEHGGSLLAVEPEKTLIACAEKLNRVLEPQPLYARFDFVRSGDSFAVMEVELIEPSLYFNMDPASPQRFAEAFIEWVNGSLN